MKNALAGLFSFLQSRSQVEERLAQYVIREHKRGRTLAEILASTKMVAEGVRTTGAALALGARHGIELPIATQMGEVLAGRADVRSALDTLMLRRQRSEAETG